MSKPRYAARRDAVEPDIVEAIEAAGCVVYRELRCDLLVRKHSDPPGIMRTLENKSHQRKDGSARLDKRQREQAEFCALTGTPYVTTPEEAVEALQI